MNSSTSQNEKEQVAESVSASGQTNKGLAEKNTESKRVADELDEFVKHIESFRASFPLTMAILNEAQKVFVKAYREFLDDHAVWVDESTKERFTVDEDNINKFRRINRELNNFSTALKTVPRSMVVALVSQYDAFLGSLIKALFYLRPEVLSSSQKQLTFAELTEFGSIDKAKEFIIEKEIETVLRQSHVDQFEWLEKKFGIKLRESLIIWPTFIELTERRNLFVHTNGRVSSQYLKVCTEHKVPNIEEAKLGEELRANRKYFISAVECLLEIGIKLGQVLWRKCRPEHAQFADHHLIEVTYELIRDKRYREAIVLLDFALQTLDRHLASDENRKIFIVNRAQAYKWSGHPEECLRIVDSVDWTASKADFRLAVAVLKDDFGDGAGLMKEIGDNGSIRKADYKAWPLFKEFRKTPEFHDAYREIFNEQFSIEGTLEKLPDEKSLHETDSPEPNLITFESDDPIS